MKKIFSFLMLLSASMGATAFAEDKAGAERPKLNVTKSEQFSDWMYRCQTVTFKGKTSPEQCGIFQDVVGTHKDTKRQFAALSLNVSQDKKTNKKVLVIKAPLGMVLPAGIDMRFDGQEFKKIPFITCIGEPLGCTAQMVLDDALESKLKSSKEMDITYVPIEIGKPFPIKLKLKDYTKAIAKL